MLVYQRVRNLNPTHEYSEIRDGLGFGVYHITWFFRYEDIGLWLGICLKRQTSVSDMF